MQFITNLIFSVQIPSTGAGALAMVFAKVVSKWITFSTCESLFFTGKLKNVGVVGNDPTSTRWYADEQKVCINNIKRK